MDVPFYTRGVQQLRFGTRYPAVLAAGKVIFSESRLAIPRARAVSKTYEYWQSRFYGAELLVGGVLSVHFVGFGFLWLVLFLPLFLSYGFKYAIQSMWVSAEQKLPSFKPPIVVDCVNPFLRCVLLGSIVFAFVSFDL